MEDGKVMINILYEDNHLVVVEKPYNVPVQADDSKDLDLLTQIKEYIKEKYQKPGNVYLGLVHRLDRPVGGIMVFAKTSKAAERLSKEIREKTFHKDYLAIVHGKLKENKTLVDKISKDTNNFKSYIDEANGKKSILEYYPLDYKEDLTLLRVHLITGRHHQIRLQLANKSHPIYGDNWYGLQEQVPIHLFAYHLEFIHPITKENMSFTIIPKIRNKWLLFKEDLEKLKEE